MQKKAENNATNLDFMLSLFYDPEDVCNIFFRNFSGHLTAQRYVPESGPFLILLGLQINYHFPSSASCMESVNHLVSGVKYFRLAVR